MAPAPQIYNWTQLHMRTEYEDHEGWENRRHLLRLWLTSTVSTHAIDPERACAERRGRVQRRAGSGAGMQRWHSLLPRSARDGPAGFPREAYLGIHSEKLMAPLDAE